METFSCHSDESTWAMAIKNINFVEAHVMNMSKNFSFIPLMAHEEMILELFFANITFRLQWQLIKFNGLAKIHMLGRAIGTFL